MDQLLKELHRKFKLFEESKEFFDPAEIAEFEKRKAEQIAHDERYQQYLKSQQGDDSDNAGGDITKMSASELVKELNTALDREGINRPESGGNPVEDIIAAIQIYKKSIDLPTDADALVSLLGLKPPRSPIGIVPTQPNNREPKQDAYPNVNPTTPDPTDMGGASEFGGAPEPEISKTFTPYGETFGQYAKTGVNAVKNLAGNAADEISNAYTNVSNAFSGIGNGFSRAYNKTDTKESVVYPRLSESDEMARLVSRLTRLDETTELNEAKWPPAVEQFLDKYGGIVGRKTDKELADIIGRVAFLEKTDGTKIATGWRRYNATEYHNPVNDTYLSARDLVKQLKKDGAELERNFGVSTGTQITGKNTTGNLENFTKNADGSWTDLAGTKIARGSQEAIALEKEAQRRLTSANPSTTSPTNSNPSTTSTPKPPTGPNPINTTANILKPNSLPANLSWAAKSKRFLKYSAALAALGLVFDNGDLIMSGVKKVADYFRGSETPDAKPGATPGTSSDTAAADAKNSEEIKALVQKIQALENDHGKDSDPAWSKAVERANAVFKRLGIPPFDNSIPKPKVTPRPVATTPKPAAPEPAVPLQSVVPQDMVQPVDLQQNYQQTPAYQQNSNTFIPFPIPLGGFGGGRGNGGGRGPQNGRGYPGAGGQIRGGVGTPGGGNRGGGNRGGR
jgi:hypothetical protein